MSEIESAFFQSDYEDLDEMLTRVKEHPFRVSVDYDTRIRVLRDQLIPDRIRQLRITLVNGGSYDPIVNRTLKDISNLYKRAEKEFFRVANDRDHTAHTLRIHQSLYKHRRHELITLTSSYRGQAARLVNEYTFPAAEVTEV